jgi:hypothetical protein
VHELAGARGNAVWCASLVLHVAATRPCLHSGTAVVLVLQRCFAQQHTHSMLHAMRRLCSATSTCCAVLRCTRGASAATAMLGVGTTLQLAIAGYALGGRATSVMAVAWQGDALLCMLLSAVAWYVGYSVVVAFGGSAAAFAVLGTCWCSGLVTLGVPEFMRTVGLASRDALGRWIGAPWACAAARVLERQHGVMRVVLATAPVAAVFACMPNHRDNIW